MGSTPVMWHISRVARLEQANLRPRTAEHMQAEAMRDGGVWIKVGSGTNET